MNKLIIGVGALVAVVVAALLGLVSGVLTAPFRLVGGLLKTLVKPVASLFKSKRGGAGDGEASAPTPSAKPDEGEPAAGPVAS